MTPPDKLSQALSQLSLLLLSEATLQDTLKQVVQFAVDALPGCDFAGITEMKDGSPRTSEYTDEQVQKIDQAQYDAGEGPCMSTIQTRELVLMDSVAEDRRWPHFRAKAAGMVGSVLALPLLVDHSIGSINIYSKRRHAFTGVDLKLVTLFAAQASVAVANVGIYEDRVTVAKQLEEAMRSRGVIEQAKGILMDRHRICAEEAFEMLRNASQEINRKVRDIAQALVDSVAKGPRKPG